MNLLSRTAKGGRGHYGRLFGARCLNGLAGSFDELHERILMVHAPYAAESWPSHLERAYPEIAGIERFSRGLGGVRAVIAEARARGDHERSGGSGRLAATLYPDFIPIASLATEEDLHELKSAFKKLPSVPDAISNAKEERPVAHLFVCTHGSRDCRCGDIGEKLFEDLSRLKKRRKLDNVIIQRVAHVGGHKFAANVILLRKGISNAEWYGLLQPSDADMLLQHAISIDPEPLYPFWRGTTGMGKKEVISQFNAHISDKKMMERPVLGDAVQLNFRTFEGKDVSVTGYEGETLMATAKRNNLPSIQATCGGFCECATCHVYIDGDMSLLPEMTDEEDEQLEFALDPDETSRLSCQLTIDDKFKEWVSKGGVICLPQY